MNPLASSVGGVTVSMVAFQAVDPGSTPGRRTSFFFPDPISPTHKRLKEEEQTLIFLCSNSNTSNENPKAFALPHDSKAMGFAFEALAFEHACV